MRERREVELRERERENLNVISACSRWYQEASSASTPAQVSTKSHNLSYQPSTIPSHQSRHNPGCGPSPCVSTATEPQDEGTCHEAPCGC